MPQAPGQGSWQRCPIQARLALQCAWIVHSGRQPFGDVGSPIKPGEQVQTAWLFLIWQLAFFPQGEGLQGSLGVSGVKHPWNGFPAYPGLHWQSSPLSVTKQSALIPQGPGSHESTIGSILGSQPSSLDFPGTNPSLHWQTTPIPGFSKQSVLGPQGLCLQPATSTKAKNTVKTS